jgi:hypothetical protein
MVFTGDRMTLGEIREFQQGSVEASPVTASLGAAAVVSVVPLSALLLAGSWLSIQSDWYWNGLVVLTVVLYGPLFWIALKWLLVKLRLAQDRLTGQDDVMAVLFSGAQALVAIFVGPYL